MQFLKNLVSRFLSLKKYPISYIRSIANLIALITIFYGALVIFSPPAIASTSIGGTITQNTTWTLANSPYVVTSSITVNSGKTLTIQPGVVIKFNSPSYSIVVNGTLQADGTPTDKIYFTSIKDDSVGGDTNGDGFATLPAKGDWSQASFSTSATNALFDNCIVKYGGYVTSGKYGVLSALCSALTLTNTSFVSNNSYAVHIDANTVLTNSGNTAVDNTRNAIVIRNNSSTSKNTRWLANDLPYVVATLTIAQGKAHTIDLGAIVKFETNGRLVINGTFNAIGTEAQRIVFTSVKDDSVTGDTNNDTTATTPVKGDWDYITFSSTSNGASSRVDYTTFRYAAYSKGSLYLNGATTTITNSLIEFSKEAGIYLNNSLQPVIADTSITNATNGIYAIGSSTVIANRLNITGCTSYPGVMDGNANLVIEDSTATNNTYNAILLKGSRSSNCFIQKQSLVYAVDSLSISSGAEFSIEPGCIFKFSSSTSSMNIYGTLLAIGSQENQIVFTSIKDDTHGGDTNGDGYATTPAASNWYKLDFSGINSSNSQLSYVKVSYAGNSYSGAISISNSSPKISHSIISNNANSGVYASGASSIIEVSDSTISNNGSNGIFLYSDASGSIIGNDISNNGRFGIDIDSSNNNLTTSYNISGNTISRNNYYYGIHADIKGHITIGGNIIEGIAGASVGYGIHISNASTATISSNTINTQTRSGVYLNNIGTAEISSSTISTCTNAIYATGGTQGTVSYNTLTNNADYAVVLVGESMLLHTSNIVTGNTYNAIELDGNRTFSTTIPNQEICYGIDNFNVLEGTTITIEPGTIFKFEDNYSDIVVWGTLLAQGSDESMIYFTSMKDDSIGGDTNSDGSETLPAPGDWFCVHCYDNASASRFDYVSVAYGAYGSAHYYLNGALRFSNCAPQITNCEIKNNYLSGILAHGAGSNPYITNSVIDGNGNGISFTSDASGTVEYCEISNNKGSGVYALVSSVLVKENSIYGNNYGVYNMSDPGDQVPIVNKNIFAANSEYDIYNWFRAEYIDAFENLWGNRHYHIGDIIDTREETTPTAYGYITEGTDEIYKARVISLRINLIEPETQTPSPVEYQPDSAATESGDAFIIVPGRKEIGLANLSSTQIPIIAGSLAPDNVVTLKSLNVIDDLSGIIVGSIDSINILLTDVSDLLPPGITIENIVSYIEENPEDPNVQLLLECLYEDSSLSISLAGLNLINGDIRNYHVEGVFESLSIGNSAFNISNSNEPLDITSTVLLNLPSENATDTILMSSELSSETTDTKSTILANPETKNITESILLSSNINNETASGSTSIEYNEVPVRSGWHCGDNHFHTQWSGPRDGGNTTITQRAYEAYESGLQWIIPTDHTNEITARGYTPLSAWSAYFSDCNLAQLETLIQISPGVEITSDIPNGDCLGFWMTESATPPENKKASQQYLVTQINNQNPGLSFAAIAHPSGDFLGQTFWTDWSVSNNRCIELISNDRYLDDNAVSRWRTKLRQTLFSKTFYNGFIVGIAGSDSHLVDLRSNLGALGTEGLTWVYDADFVAYAPDEDNQYEYSLLRAMKSGAVSASGDGSLGAIAIHYTDIHGDYVSAAQGSVAKPKKGTKMTIKIVQQPRGNRWCNISIRDSRLGDNTIHTIQDPNDMVVTYVINVPAEDNYYYAQFDFYHVGGVSKHENVITNPIFVDPQP